MTGFYNLTSLLNLALNYEELEREEIKERICMNSIHYAKRQMTFFRSFRDVKWIDAEDTEALRETLYLFLQ